MPRLHSMSSGWRKVKASGSARTTAVQEAFSRGTLKNPGHAFSGLLLCSTVAMICVHQSFSYLFSTGCLQRTADVRSMYTSKYNPRPRIEPIQPSCKPFGCGFSDGRTADWLRCIFVLCATAAMGNLAGCFTHEQASMVVSHVPDSRCV